MRATSSYLYTIRNDSPIRIHLGGSTPPILQTAQQCLLAQRTQLAAEMTAEIKKILTQGLGCENVELVPASTQACVQVLAAITEPGDTILIEYPTYEPYLAAAKFLNLKIKRFKRTGDPQKDLADIKKQSSKAHVILLSNPHCPTGMVYDADFVNQLQKLKPFLLLDEVFLPLTKDGKLTQIKSWNKKTISISSLSKSTGLGEIRFGWVTGTPDVLDRVRKVGNHFHSQLPTPILTPALHALRNFSTILAEINVLANQNRPILQQSVLAPHLSQNLQKGFFTTLKVPKGISSGKVFMQKLLQEGILVRDGAHFEMPKHVRLHTLLPTEDFRQAVAKISSFYA